MATSTNMATLEWLHADRSYPAGRIHSQDRGSRFEVLCLYLGPRSSDLGPFAGNEFPVTPGSPGKQYRLRTWETIQRAWILGKRIPCLAGWDLRGPGWG